MTTPTRRTPIFAAAWSALVVLASGCGGPREDPSRKFIPDPEVARKAVATMLDEWAAGKDGTPAATVNVVDKARKPGRRPVRHEILGEVAAESGRGFAVRLAYAEPEEEVVDRYLVIGTGPVWVFRQADYEMISHWMHPMDAASAPEPDAGPKP